MSATSDTAAKALDELTARAKRSDLDHLDESYIAKVDGLGDQGKLDAETVQRLHVMWKMLKTSDDAVPWSSKAIIMAAISYFASPLDVLPDFVGKKGYADDALVIRLAFERLGDSTSAFS